ncbi:hypothetical protein [Pseudidiomarina aestuarii]|uniref:hypothetical protein n=1 Tax=Pseudidiomarina aestuarii TaxID=624146 RepID=UPI003A987ED3
MHWLNINSDKTHYPQTVQDACDSFQSVELATTAGSLQVIYDQRLWSRQPVSQSSSSLLVIAGWFVLNDEINNLDALNRLIDETGLASALQEITQGIFVGYHQTGADYQVFTDWFGLAAHYYYRNDEHIRVSPSASAISAAGEVDPFIDDIIQRKGHVWGKHTRYKNVFRMLPGEMLSNHLESRTYCNFKTSDVKAVSEIPNLIQKNLSIFEKQTKLVSLSAGFDSRLLALVGDASFAYTWGPENSKDIRNSKFICEKLGFDSYHFPFRRHKYTDDDVGFLRWLLDGQNKTFEPQFFRNFKAVSQKATGQFISLDGYLGDVLQRGVYLYGPKLRSEFKKLFPLLFSKDKPTKVLLERYSSLTQAQKSLLVTDSNNLLRAIQADYVDSRHHVTLFEFMFGRGFAHIYMGGIAMNGVVNVVVPAFAQPAIVKACVTAPVSDVLDYTVFKDVWKHLDSDIVRLTSEGMYSPKTPKRLIPFFNFVGRVLTNYVPKFKNYGKE